MKKPKKDAQKCPHCGNYPTIRKGFRKNKQRTIQKYQCTFCKTHFTLQPNLQKHKTYDLKTILDTISNYNLNTPLRKQNIPKSTIHNWIKSINLPFNRLRNKVTENPIIKQQFIHHKQPFLYQYHSLKLDFAKKFPTLINYLKNINKELPEDIFNNSERISQISKSIETPTKGGDEAGDVPYGVPSRISNGVRNPSSAFGLVGVSLSKSKINLKIKQNYATKLAEIALSITNDNKQRHNIIENFMLINDTATIATEIPIYLTENETKTKALTGHIDILQIKFHKLYILDFKPEPTTEEQAIQQLKLYREALSKRTSIPKYKFKLAFFNNREYCEIN